METFTLGLISALLLLLLGWIKMDTGDTRKTAKEARDIGVANKCQIEEHERVLARHDAVIYRRFKNGSAQHTTED